MSCDSPQPRDNNDLEALTSSLSQSYEEIALLHRVSDGMRVTQQPQDLFSRLLHDVLEVINAEKLIIFWRGNNETDVEPPMVASVGALPLSRVHLDVIWDRSTACASQAVQNQSAGSGLNGILIDSDVDRSYSYEWPKPIRNIVGIPIRRDQQNLGVLVALNKIGKPDFDSIDVKLLISVGNEIAVFLENFRLYHEMQELFLGSLRALSNSIDAKDTYTCGHSERVAFICRHLAEKLSFEPTRINNVYLAGLLHDVGKIGVSEAVLCKPGRLTDDEFTQIKKHPQIGADILKSIKQMEHISRIVLSHHER
ncbi:MAG: HD domain-containing protein, partial [Candidatus Aminicenantes bacterium]